MKHGYYYYYYLNKGVLNDKKNESKKMLTLCAFTRKTCLIINVYT